MNVGKTELYVLYMQAMEIMDLKDGKTYKLSDGPREPKLNYTALEVAKQDAEVILMVLDDITNCEVRNYGNSDSDAGEVTSEDKEKSR